MLHTRDDEDSLCPQSRQTHCREKRQLPLEGQLSVDLWRRTDTSVDGETPFNGRGDCITEGGGIGSSRAKPAGLCLFLQAVLGSYRNVS